VTPGPIPVEFAGQWLARMMHRREFPPQWRAALRAEWRNANNPRLSESLTTGGGQKKNAPAVSASVQAIARDQQLRQLREELAEAQCMADAANAAGADDGERDALRAIEAKIAAVLKGGGE
jgi:hypothetical protein